MNLSELFIRRPVMTTLVMIGVVIFGLMGYQLLPISALPNVEYPFISVSASLPGATPETMASSVAAPLERQFSSIAGLNSFNSTSSTGSTNISLQFDFSRNANDVAKDVQAAISAAAGQLPQNLPHPPTYRKVNPSVAPVLYLYLYSDTLPISTVDEYAEVTIGQPISMIDGVAQVQVYGQQAYAVRIQVDPQKLTALGIGLDQVQTAIQQANVILPTGSFSGKDKTYMIQANGQLNDASAYRPLIVAYKNGAPVRLQDIAQVIDSVQNDKVANLYNGHRSVVLAVQPQPDGNTVKIVDAVKKLLPSLRAQVPASIEMGIMYDRSQTIRASIDDVQFTLFLSVCLVVLVIFLFLRDMAATVIPSLALPVAIIGTFAVMYVLGYSLDNLSLMALTLSVGFVIDDAIVVLENIVRHREMGLSPLEAALQGSKQISFTVVSMTLSLVAVFIPLLFMGDVTGMLFREFSMTLAISILVSGVISLTLTPMLSAKFLSTHNKSAPSVNTALLSFYRRTLSWCLRYKKTTLCGAFACVVLTVMTFRFLTINLFPEEDRGFIWSFVQMPSGMSKGDTEVYQNKLNKIVQKHPAVENFATLNFKDYQIY